MLIHDPLRVRLRVLCRMQARVSEMNLARAACPGAEGDVDRGCGQNEVLGIAKASQDKPHPSRPLAMGISRSSRHKRSATGAQHAHYRKKRKFELDRQPANTMPGTKRIHTGVGNLKYRALRLESDNFA
jgi:Ribosomal protein S8e